MVSVMSDVRSHSRPMSRAGEYLGSVASADLCRLFARTCICEELVEFVVQSYSFTVTWRFATTKKI